MPQLYVVATPIGNLNDLTPRVEEALSACDLVAAEDTRVTMKLLNHFGLKKPMVSCHRHNEDQRSEGIIRRMLDEDLTVALCCDAGTPAISDPGHLLVRAAWEAGISVTPVPGPSAVVTTLSCAGFDAREFAFYGFLPREKKPLREKLRAMHKTGIPVCVAYESPHRIVDLVEEIAAIFPEALLCVCADLTKRFEWIVRAPAPEALASLKANPNVEKGEYCLAIDFSPVPPAEEDKAPVSAAAFLFERVAAGASVRDAAREASEKGYPRNEVYRAKLLLQALEEE